MARAKNTPEQTYDFKGAVAALSEKLRAQASRPNVYGYRPHAKQELFHCRTNKNGLYIGGNRAGKTVAGIAEDIFWLTGRHPYRDTPEPPVRGRIVGVDFLNGIEKILKPELARWIPLSDLKGGSWESAYEKSTRTLTLENGSFVEFMSYDQDLDKFAGTSRHFIHFDEEPPEDIFLECKTRLIDTGGAWWMTLTPVEGMLWIYDQIYMNGKENPESNISVIEVDMLDNPYLHEGEVQEFISGLSDDDKESRVHGKFIQRGGLVYKEFNRELHVIDSYMPPKDHLWIASLDHGYNNPTAWLWHSVSPDGTVVTFDEHYVSKEIVEYHARAVGAINQKHGRPPDQYIGDPSIRNVQPLSGTSIQEEYARFGVPITLGNNDVAAGIERVQSYLKVRENGRPNWYITRNCSNLIWELGRYTYKTWANKRTDSQNNNYEIARKKDDHAVDSARYFFMSRPDLRAEIPGDKISAGNIMGASVAFDEKDIWKIVTNTTEWQEESINVDDNLGADF